MRMLDITRVMDPSMAIYPGNPPYTRTVVRDLPASSSALSSLTLGTHTGTHVDAPRHVLQDGTGIDRVSLEKLFGEAVVLDLRTVDTVITAEDLRPRDIPRGVIVLLKTRNSSDDPHTFQEDFVACDASAAEILRDLETRAVGIDGPSIKKFQWKDRTHEILLERGIPIIEGLDLSRAAEGRYTLVCLPLRLKDADGAPARAILLEEPLTNQR